MKRDIAECCADCECLVHEYDLMGLKIVYRCAFYNYAYLDDIEEKHCADSVW